MSCIYIWTPKTHPCINGGVLQGKTHPLQAWKDFLAEKNMRKCCNLVTFAYKKSRQQKHERMNNLLTIFHAKETLRSLMRKF
jgi:hypothetical protein